MRKAADPYEFFRMDLELPWVSEGRVIAKTFRVNSNAKFSSPSPRADALGCAHFSQLGGAMRWIGAVVSVVLAVVALTAARGTLADERTDGVRNPAPGQLRGLWVDAFGPGIKTPVEIDQLIADARRMKLNALFAQVGRRGDCYCNKSAMPRTSDPAVPAGFDPLEYLLEKAHGVGIQVHAWIITTSIHNAATPPVQPDHVFNTNGLTKTGRENWIMTRFDGMNRAGNDYLLDPGHPDAVEYITRMYASVVENYDVDGIQFDRVRYPDQNEPALQPTWGYNATALERFAAETGITERPLPTDPVWMQWRRDQVTNLVRRVYLEVKRLKPEVWVSAATITYGAGPKDMAAWRSTRTYTEVLQDWAGWVREGILDLNIPMNYKRDFVPDQALWFDQWNAFAVQVRGSRAVASGTAIYLNPQENSVRQASLSLTRDKLDGWVGYSYRTPDADVNAGKATQAVVFPALADKLTAAGAPLEQNASWGRPGVVNAVLGRVQRGDGASGLEVELLAQGSVVRRTRTDGNGYYGFVTLPLGELEVRLRGQTESVKLERTLGRVTVAPTLNAPI
jgi:uncharacterized lipoprotein YddW (UPF0748 family)